jgi:hypothetical protein
LKDLSKLEGLLDHVDDGVFQAAWASVKQANKERLAHYVQTTLGLKVDTNALFDVQIKVGPAYVILTYTSWVNWALLQRLHEYKVYRHGGEYVAHGANIECSVKRSTSLVLFMWVGKHIIPGFVVSYTSSSAT